MSSQTRLGWRVYVCGKEWDIYAYTIVGSKGEAEAIKTLRTIIPLGNLRLRAQVVTINLGEYETKEEFASSIDDSNKESETQQETPNE